MARSNVVRDYGGISALDRRAERRRKLLEAGKRIWGESGIAEVTVRGVCSASGLTPRYFYEQFPNRDDLLVAIADQLRTELTATMVTASLADPGDLGAKLRTAFTAFLDAVAADPHSHRILTTESNIAGLREGRDRMLDTIVELVLHYGPGLLGFEPADPADLRRGALFVVGGVNQLIEAWLRDPKESTTELADICVALTLATVTARRP
ncbi:TetR/AcrR family transcriptional regulator [Antrihabitans stalactiti]|uniref:TetR/AcrR family transcriptional regulator n=1 Tax=Antrihabitans stalactiti TaxID=2584121 RepID=A0A848KPD3_9NOCA|nr:helix-turn-helix domain-containing protein [Antrihabitans stalactiti]NMN98150.1 TetR/AcrR family transcriptional regulator [Antrihabitans stalactiti]